MPIFEYVCRKCGHRFEQLVYGEAAPECPSCRGKKVEKQLSIFAAATKGLEAARRGPAACGSCGDPRGPGSCSTD